MVTDVSRGKEQPETRSWLQGRRQWRDREGWEGTEEGGAVVQRARSLGPTGSGMEPGERRQHAGACLRTLLYCPTVSPGSRVSASQGNFKPLLGISQPLLLLTPSQWPARCPAHSDAAETPGGRRVGSWDALSMSCWDSGPFAKYTAFLGRGARASAERQNLLQDRPLPRSSSYWFRSETLCHLLVSGKCLGNRQAPHRILCSSGTGPTSSAISALTPPFPHTRLVTREGDWACPGRGGCSRPCGSALPLPRPSERLAGVKENHVRVFSLVTHCETVPGHRDA